jgi:serine/threonine protein kinase
MSGEYSSGQKFREGDLIKGYEILKAFDPGGFAFSGKAKAPNGRIVFFKKYKRPGGSSPWLAGFIDYQNELKRRIQSDPPAKSLCYEFIEFFDISKEGSAIPMRAFYQVFEWIESGLDLRQMLDQQKANPAAYSWNQRVIFARVMTAGVNAIHKVGVIHSDLKPENFYLLPEPTISAKYKVRVIDLDFSLLDDRPAPWHGVEGYVGTPGYLSPEHLGGKVPVKGSDVFTLGLMLGEILGGEHPAAPNMDTYEEQVKNGRLKPVVLERAIDGVPDGQFLTQVINSCFRPEPQQRPTAEQILLALNGRLPEWNGSRPRSATPAPSLVPTTPLPPLPPTPAPAPSLIPASPLPPITPLPPLPGPKPKPAPVAPVAPIAPTPAVSPVATKPGPVAKPSATIVLVGPGTHTLKAHIPTKIGRSVLHHWSEDFDKFMSPEQFHVFKDTGGFWMIEHCHFAKNQTNVDGHILTTPTRVTAGMVVTLGKTGKCPITLKLE